MPVFINCISVPAGREDDFLEVYQQVNAYMATRPGYVGNRLHRSLDPAAPYRFVNVVDWSTPQEFAAAHDETFRAMMADPARQFFTTHPALYQVIHEAVAVPA